MDFAIISWTKIYWTKSSVYDTGAATTALPLGFGDTLGLTKKGEFTVASGEAIPNFGNFRVTGIDEKRQLERNRRLGHSGAQAAWQRGRHLQSA